MFCIFNERKVNNLIFFLNLQPLNPIVFKFFFQNFTLQPIVFVNVFSKL
jgi:hypothetical protein